MQGAGVKVWLAHSNLLQTGGRKKARFPSTQVFTLTGRCMATQLGCRHPGEPLVPQAPLAALPWLISILGLKGGSIQAGSVGASVASGTLTWI